MVPLNAIRLFSGVCLIAASAAIADTAASPDTGASAEERLATVGASTVTLDDLVRFAERQADLVPLLGTEGGRAQVLRQLIETRLLNMAAIEYAALGPDHTEADLDAAAKKLEAAELSADEIDEAQIEAYYTARREQFGIPAAVHIREIYFPFPEGASEADRAAVKAQAEAVLVRAKAGEPFSALAQQYAHTEPLRRMGGDQKFLPLYRFPYLEAVTAGMKEQELSEVLELDGGYQIVQFLGRRDAIPAPLEDVRDYIRQQLQLESVQRKRDAFLEQYGKKVGVEILQPSLAAAWPEGASD